MCVEADAFLGRRTAGQEGNLAPRGIFVLPRRGTLLWVPHHERVEPLRERGAGQNVGRLGQLLQDVLPGTGRRCRH